MAKKTVIVGAGSAGLATAYELEKKGLDYLLLEAADYPGGRASSCHYDPENPEAYYSTGAVFTEPNNLMSMKYMEELGLGYAPMDKKVYGMWYKDKMSYLNDDGNLFHAMASVKGLPLSLGPQGLKFLANLAPEIAKIKPGERHPDFTGLLEVSKKSIAEWCEEKKVPEVVDLLIGPMIIAMTIGRPEEVSMAHPVALLSGMEGMGQIIGSYGALNGGLYEKVKHNTRLSTPVEEIVIEDGKVKGVKLADGEFIEADNVVCCTDTHDAMKLMPALPESIASALKTVTYSSTYHYEFKLDERITPEDYVFVFLPQSGNPKLTTIFEENTHDVVGPKGTGMMHAFTAGWWDHYFQPMTEEERVEAVLDECCRYFPTFREHATVVGCQRYDRAISLEAPEQVSAIHAMKETYQDEVEGLYLAGEYLYLIACTEGAYITGIEVAEQIAERQ